MYAKWLALLLVALFLGCSSTGDASYDTSDNPDGFPQPALDLIEDLDNGRLVGFDSITFAFGELYTAHSELLDHPAWKKVISTLGQNFGRAAEEHDARGREGWKEAAEYYQLAAFARPEDTIRRRLAAETSAWLTAVNSDHVDVGILDDGAITLDNLIPFLRHFLLGGSDYVRFYRERLHTDIEQKVATTNILGPNNLSGLEDTDRALLRFSTLAGPEVAPPIVTFDNPEIDIVAVKLTRTGATNYAAEFFLIPHAPITRRLALLIMGEDTNGLPVPVSILPSPPATQWPTDELVAVSRGFACNNHIVSATLSLVLEESESARFLYLSGSNDSTFALDATALTRP